MRFQCAIGQLKKLREFTDRKSEEKIKKNIEF